MSGAPGRSIGGLNRGQGDDVLHVEMSEAEATPVTGPGRRAAAADAAARLAEMVKSQGRQYLTWYLMLLDIRDVLASPASDEDALRDAGEMFAMLYYGGRDFSEFHFEDEDKAIRDRKNTALEQAVRTIREATRSLPPTPATPGALKAVFSVSCYFQRARAVDKAAVEWPVLYSAVAMTK